MSKVDVIMPQMGESIAEGTLTRWIKSVGDPVDRDEDLFEISTDKVDADIPSPAAGILAEVLVEEGETVEVNTVVARIETDASAASAPAKEEEEAEEPAAEPAEEPAAEPAEAPAAGEAEEEVTEEETAETEEERVAASAAAGTAAARSATPQADGAPAGGGAGDGAGGDGAATREERLKTRSTPLVRKIAAEHDVDISRIEGSGAGGRVTRDDILSFIESGATEREEPAEAEAAAAGREEAEPAAAEREPEAKPAVRAEKPAAATPAAATPTSAETRPAPAATPARREEKSAAPAAPSEGGPDSIRVPIPGATLDIKLPKVPIRDNDRVEDMSRVRLRTMEHMLMSQSVSAHVTSVSEIDFERVVQLRRKLKGKYAERGVKLTFGPFIYRAVIEGLREYPILNSSVDGTRIVYHSNINLGLAVAVNDGKELIVPVLKDADQLSLIGLAKGANDLAEKARTRSLDFDDIQGGTFTITNVGVFGNLFGTPIINQPQVAILGTGVIEKRPVVVQDDLGNDVIAIRHRAYFGLSYDHRIVDGAMAAFFLNKVQETIENFPDEG